MVYYLKGTYLTKKKGKLHIYVRNNKDSKGRLKSKFYVGRTYIQGKSTVKSSGTANKKEAVKVLEKWYDRLQFQKDEGIQIHTKTFSECLKQFEKSLDGDISRTSITLKGIRQKFNIIKQCKGLMKLDVNKVNIENIKNTFLKWRIDREKKNKKTLRGATLKGDLVAISGFLNWCYKKELRKSKMEGLTVELLSKRLRHQRTQRTQFNYDEYQKLLKISRARIKNGRGTRVKFDRERLHQFCIFMVGTGLRVDEALQLEWEDIRCIDREKVVNRQATETIVSAYGKDFLSQLERYYLQINVGISKSRPHTAYGTGSAYFAYQNIIKLYTSNSQFNCKVGEGTIFKLHSYREGLNSLLDEADLKYEKLGDTRVKRDSKSFRHTFIQFMLNKGMSSTAIAKMCGTSTEMIDKYYTSNMALDTMMDTFNKVKGGHLKIVS